MPSAVPSAVPSAADATYRGLLAAVLAEPGDDLIRLATADWLEENGQPERAEFVRVQCALAAGDALGGWHGASLWPAAVCRRAGCPCVALRDRERELFLSLSGARLGLPGWVFSTDGAGRAWLSPLDGAARLEVRLRRGFVEQVTCTLDEWCGRECGRCGGSGRIHVGPNP